MVVMVRAGRPTRVDGGMGCRGVAETWELMTASRAAPRTLALSQMTRRVTESQDVRVEVAKPEAAVCAWLIAGVTAQQTHKSSSRRQLQIVSETRRLS
jgi:hypothetical protein